MAYIQSKSNQFISNLFTLVNTYLQTNASKEALDNEIKSLYTRIHDSFHPLNWKKDVSVYVQRMVCPNTCQERHVAKITMAALEKDKTRISDICYINFFEKRADTNDKRVEITMLSLLKASEVGHGLDDTIGFDWGYPRYVINITNKGIDVTSTPINLIAKEMLKKAEPEKIVEAIERIFAQKE